MIDGGVSAVGSANDVGEGKCFACGEVIEGV